MGLKRWLCVGVLAMLASWLPGGVIASAGQGGLILLTPQEATQWSLGEGDWPPAARLRGLPRGPRVVIQHPAVKDTGDGPLIEAAPPVNFVISFEQNREPVDMDSLEVKARKGFFSLSLTSRLKPYVRGTSLQAEGLTIPDGRFLIQIEIADTAGTRTIETYRLDVRRP